MRKQYDGLYALVVAELKALFGDSSERRPCAEQKTNPGARPQVTRILRRIRG
jgi:hypothetical protein